MNEFLDESLHAISNVIELKPNKKYLIAFKSDEIAETLVRRDIQGVYGTIRKGVSVEVIEAPVTQEGDTLE